MYLFIRKNNIIINFIKVKTYSSKNYNNIVDKLAVLKKKKQEKKSLVKNVVEHIRRNDNSFEYYCYWKN